MKLIHTYAADRDDGPSAAPRTDNPRYSRWPIGAARQQAFTLIELILVLTLLAILTSLAAPSLSSFFRGRALDSEARQLLSLTHAGQSRAVSDGFPMLLWIDLPGHAYGLVEEAASQNGNSPAADPKAEEFTFEDPLQIETVNASPLREPARLELAPPAREPASRAPAFLLARRLPNRPARTSQPNRPRQSVSTRKTLEFLSNDWLL